MEVWPRILTIVKTHSPCALVTICELKGSVPQELGARMIIQSDGGFYGTIGGGALEWDVIKLTRDHLKSGAQDVLHHKYALGPALGQCCGGHVTLMIEPFNQLDIQTVESLSEAETKGFCWTKSHLKDGRLIRQLTSIKPNTLFIQTDKDSYLEVFGDTYHPVYLFGAGHVAQALMLALAPLPFQVKMIDAREDIIPRVMPANFSAIVSQNPTELLKSAPDGVFILVMTHSHALDLEIISQAIRQNRFNYVGLIGSMTKRKRFESQLLKQGINKKNLSDLICPIGIEGIHSKKPAAIATSVAAELLIRLENI